MKKIGLLVIAFTLMALSACSVFEKPKVYSTQPASGPVQEASQGSAAETPLAPPKNVKKKDKKAQGTKTADFNRRHKVPGGNDANKKGKKYTQTAMANSIEGEWTIYSVRGTTVEGEERPYINFDLAANRFYGSNGCNILNGDLALSPEKGSHSLRLDNVISTLQMCQDAPYEYLINLALSDVRSYSVRQEAPLTFIDLKGANGKTIMVLRRHNMDFLNGAWRVETLNSTPLQEEADATLTIDIPDLRIHGCTGCNIFNGDIFIDPDKLHSMQFLSIGTTRKMCRNSRETEFILALEEVESAKALSPTSVDLLNRAGKPVMTLKKIELEDRN